MNLCPKLTKPEKGEIGECAKSKGGKRENMITDHGGKYVCKDRRSKLLLKAGKDLREEKIRRICMYRDFGMQ